MNRWVVAALGATALLVSGALAACTPPTGGTVSVSSGRLAFTAASGKANNVVVTTASGGNLRVADTGDRVIAGTGCTQDGDNRALCPAAGVTQIAVSLRDGDDSAVNGTDLSTSSDGIRGGPGDDVLTGGSAGDLIVGDEGSDTMNGGSGTDVLREAATGSAVDVIDADVFIGGSGIDTASYATSDGSATIGVVADLDGFANDGQPGERDEIRTDIENITGTGAGDDTLIGNGGPNLLQGLSGIDTLRGGGGNDRLLGVGGGDFLEGEAGDDTLRGGAGFDSLGGGSGTDDCDVEADGGDEFDCEI